MTFFYLTNDKGFEENRTDPFYPEPGGSIKQRLMKLQ